MIDLLLGSKAVIFLAGYVLAAAVVALLNHREFKRCPEKGTRYKALPTRFKAMCLVGVLPLFAGSLVVWWLFVPAFVSAFLTEMLCIRWYKKAGLL